MTQSRGYLKITDPAAAKPVEIDTLTCCHCNAIILLHNDDGTAIDDAFRMCLPCSKAKCPACFGQGCTPFEEKLKRSEARGISLRSMGLG